MSQNALTQESIEAARKRAGRDQVEEPENTELSPQLKAVAERVAYLIANDNDDKPASESVSSAYWLVRRLMTETGFTPQQIAATVIEMEGLTTAFMNTINARDEDIRVLTDLLNDSNHNHSSATDTKEVDELRAENAALKERLANLEKDASSADKLQDENRALTRRIEELEQKTNASVDEELHARVIAKFQDNAKDLATAKLRIDNLEGRLRRAYGDLRELHMQYEEEQDYTSLTVLQQVAQDIKPLIPLIAMAALAIDKSNEYYSFEMLKRTIPEWHEEIYGISLRLHQATLPLYSLESPGDYLKGRDALRKTLDSGPLSIANPQSLSHSFYSEMSGIVHTLGTIIGDVGFNYMPHSISPCAHSTIPPVYYEILPLQFYRNLDVHSGEREEHTFYVIYMPGMNPDAPIFLINPDHYNDLFQEEYDRFHECIYEETCSLEWHEEAPEDWVNCYDQSGVEFADTFYFNGDAMTLEEAPEKIAQAMCDYFQKEGFLTPDKVRAYQGAEGLRTFQRENPERNFMPRDLV